MALPQADQGITWGCLVAERRQSLGLSQTQLAARAGTTQQTVSRIEGGVSGLSDRMKWTIASALQCSVSDLFPWPDQEGAA